MSAAAESELFARKGHAAPAGFKGLARSQSDGAGVAAVDNLPLLTGTPADAASAAPNGGETEHSEPAGSLLTFRLRGRAAISAELRAALDGVGKPAHRVEPTAAERQAEPAAESIIPAPPSRPTPVEAKREPAPPAAANQPEARKDDASPRPASTRIDRPLFAPAPTAPVTTEPLKAAPAVPRQAAPAVPARPSLARTVLPAAAAVVAVAVVGWLIARSEPTGAPAGTEPSTVADSSSEPTSAVLAASAHDTGHSLDNAPAPQQQAEPAAAQAVVTPSPQVVATAPSVAAAAEPAMASAPDVPAAPPMPPPPTLDVVRVEPGAAPVIAGRAAPGSELLVLDNGLPLGSATADHNGEWALVGEAPLAAGRHELTLALKTAEGPVVIEQADTVAPDATELDAAEVDAAAAALLVPPAKPAITAPGEKLYVVQLASVPSSADAEREWTRLQAAYPALLGSRAMMVDAVKLGDRGTFYRLRTGPFPDREAARALCRELNGAGAECLVVRQAAE